MYSFFLLSLQTEKKHVFMSSNILIRVNFIVDKDSNSFSIEKECLKRNDGNKYSLPEVRDDEMHENYPYPSLVVGVKGFRDLDIARRISEGRGISDLSAYIRWYKNLDTYKNSPINGNVMDLYVNPGKNCYYLDRECTNAAVLMIFVAEHCTHYYGIETTLLPCPTGLRDKFSKKYYSTFNNDSVLMISTNENRETMMGRIRRIIPLYMAEAGISECIYKWEDGCVIYVDDNMNSADDDVIMYIM